MKEMEQASSFLDKQAGHSEDQLLKTYKLYSRPAAIADTLLKECKKHNYELIKQQLRSIDQGKPAHSWWEEVQLPKELFRAFAHIWKA